MLSKPPRKQFAAPAQCVVPTALASFHRSVFQLLLKRNFCSPSFKHEASGATAYRDEMKQADCRISLAVKIVFKKRIIAVCVNECAAALWQPEDNWVSIFFSSP